MIDLTPATERMKAVLAAITDGQLDGPTPCPDARVGDLADHVGSLVLGFTAAAHKQTSTQSGPPPKPSAGNLEPGWRDRVGRDLDALADAWSQPSAWDGFTAAGGIDLPGEVAGLVALDELVVHGWDLAVASGQAYDVPGNEVDAALGFVSSFDAPRDGNLFGPIVPVSSSAPPLHQLLGLTGRDPSWRPA